MASYQAAEGTTPNDRLSLAQREGLYEAIQRLAWEAAVLGVGDPPPEPLAFDAPSTARMIVEVTALLRGRHAPHRVVADQTGAP